MAEARACLAGMRRGLASLMARYEPDRFRPLAEAMETFGARETLSGMRLHEPVSRVVPVMAPVAGSYAVH